jgi:subtilisin family serine protease
MADDIYDAKDLAPANALGNAPDRFQVLVRVQRNLPRQALDAIAKAQGGRIEQLVLLESSPLAGDKGSIFVLSFPDTPARDAIVTALSRRPGVEVAELDATVYPALSSTDTHYANGNLWGMLGPTGDGIGTFSNAFGIHADVAWARADISTDGKVGSMRTVVGVIDTGIDPLHPDLYLNVWINQNEIPLGLASDQDGDGVITFRDLNVTSAGNFVNAVSDVNGNGRIDADDILRLPAWANGIDNDGNGYVDDLFGWDFYSNDNRPFESYDGTGTNANPSDSYHGTHVSGTIGALANGAGVVGVVWDVQIMPLRFLGPASSGGSTSAAIEAIYYYTAMGQSHPGLNFVGTNNSWGGPTASTLLSSAIQTAGNNGHLFFAAAGNSTSNNDATPYYPAAYAVTSNFQGVFFDPVITVASITNTGALSSFSNWGANTVDIAASGTTIASTLSGNEWFGVYTYVNLNGTSMATPHVTGTAALISSEYPGLHPADLKSAILNGRIAYSTLSGLVVSGGRLNVPGAINLVGPAPAITINDPLLTLADAPATVTFTFPVAVVGFDTSDIAVSTGHGAISGLTTANNVVWTATFTPTNVETQGARISVGNRFTSFTGAFGRSGQSEAFAIDRVAPTATVTSIAAARDGTGADIDGGLSAPLGSGEVLKVFRNGASLGNATVTGTSWRFDDTTALADGTYQYTARPVDPAGNEGSLSGQAPLVVASSLPAPTITISDTLLTLADPLPTVTFTFSEAVTGFDDTDISVTPGHGSLFGLTTANNVVWTATFTPANVETQSARVSVGDQYGSSVGGKLGTAGQSAAFTIDRIAPAATVTTIAAGRDGTGADVTGTLNALLGSGETLTVFRNGALLGNATVTGTNWLFDDLTALANGTYQYTARPFDSVGNAGTLSNEAALVVAPDIDFALVLNTLESGYWGQGFNGATDADGRIKASFTSTGKNLVLSLTGYDIDWATEVRVLLNGRQFAYLEVTPNDATGPSEIIIPASQQKSGTNVLTFANSNPTWAWGVTDLVLQNLPTTDFALTLGVTHTASYGKGFNGANDADGRVTGRFTSTGQDLVLSLTGFDIDWSTEVRVLLNGSQFGHLTTTPDNATGPSLLTIPASQQLPGVNVLTFVNGNASWLWGITDLLIAPATIT